MRAQRATSAGVTGVDTVGSGRARSEQAATVVLVGMLWLQSMSTLPARRSRRMLDTTSSGCARSTSCAQPLDTSRTISHGLGGPRGR